MTLPQATLHKLYERWPVARLATITQQGSPHTVPIVFCAHADALYAPIDGKRKRGSTLQRFRNLTANPQASLLLDEYTNDWLALWWVRIDAQADLYQPDDVTGGAIAARLLDKYPQYRDPQLMFDTGSYMRLQPTRVSWWTQSNSAAAIEAGLARLEEA